MNAMTTSPEQGRVEYYDATWGGWRRIDTFGDAPTAILPLAKARKIAKDASARSMLMQHMRVVVLTPTHDEKRVITYRRGEVRR